MASKKKDHTPLAFGKTNYIWMAASVMAIFIGFIVMSLDDQPHGFGVIGLTLGPMIVLAGFVLAFVAIFKKDTSRDS